MSLKEERAFRRFRTDTEIHATLGPWNGPARLIEASLGGAVIRLPVSLTDTAMLTPGDVATVAAPDLVLRGPIEQRGTVVRVAPGGAGDASGLYVGLSWTVSPQNLETLLAGSDPGETLYDGQGQPIPPGGVRPFIIDVNTQINAALLRYLAQHPEAVHQLSSRAFEELVAAILKDLGLDVHLTRATRDGGVDILAYVCHQVAHFLVLVECKKWAPENPVGLEVVQRLYGVHQSLGASKSLIVTSSSFTKPAKDESKLYKGVMELKDFEDLKCWLEYYSGTA